MIDSLREIVECPVCMEVPRNGPIHQCRNGHVVCNQCKQRLERCPACREPITGRSLKTEQLLELVPSPCKFSQSGCKTELVPSLIRNHEIDCETKLMQCPRLYCLTKVLPQYLAHHLHNSNERCKVINHKCVISSTGDLHIDGSLNVPDSTFTVEQSQSWVPGMIKNFGQTFFRESVRTRDGKWMFWIYYLGPNNEAKNYFYTISICNSDKSVEYKFTGQVTSMRQDYAAFIKDPNGLILSDNMVNNVLENNSLKYKMTLLRPANQVNRPLMQRNDVVDENTNNQEHTAIGEKRTQPKDATDDRNQKRTKI
jgi:E3 ubiquitin-protein ligase SIAH1